MPLSFKFAVPSSISRIALQIDGSKLAVRGSLTVLDLLQILFGGYIQPPEDWTPVIEVPSNEKPFLTRSPNDILRSGDYTRVPMIIGSNNREGSIIYAGELK